MPEYLRKGVAPVPCSQRLSMKGVFGRRQKPFLIELKNGGVYQDPFPHPAVALGSGDAWIRI